MAQLFLSMGDEQWQDHWNLESSPQLRGARQTRGYHDQCFGYTLWRGRVSGRGRIGLNEALPILRKPMSSGWLKSDAGATVSYRRSAVFNQGTRLGLYRVVDELQIPVMAFGLKMIFVMKCLKVRSTCCFMRTKSRRWRPSAGSATKSQYEPALFRWTGLRRIKSRLVAMKPILFVGTIIFILKSKNLNGLVPIQKGVLMYDQLQSIEEPLWRIRENYQRPGSHRDTKRLMELTKKKLAREKNRGCLPPLQKTVQSIADAEEMLAEKSIRMTGC